MLKIHISILALVFAGMTACHPIGGPDKTVAGALLGGGWGAGAGAVIGNQLDKSGPGAAIGAGFGVASGILTGIGLDVAEETEIERQQELDALKVRVASNQRKLMILQDALDRRDQKLSSTSVTAQVFFDEGRASLRSGAVKQLERLAETIRRNPYVGHVHLHGHSDIEGGPDLNMRLSEARARSVATFLANYGVSLDMIQISSHGSKRPLANNKSEAGRQLNRRVEVVLLK